MTPFDNRVNFQSADWEFVKAEAEKSLKHQRQLLENPETTYRETQLARGHIKALKTILNLPQTASTAA